MYGLFANDPINFVGHDTVTRLFVAAGILFCFHVVDRKTVLSVTAFSRLWHNCYTIKLHLHSIFYNFTILLGYL